MQTLAFDAPATETPAGRFDLYAQVHKGIRVFLGAILGELGRLDCADSGQVKRVLDGLDELLDYCSSHMEKEERFVHTALEARQPGGASRIAVDHNQQAESIRALRRRADALAGAEGPAREREAAALYRAFACFVAENLEHMELEETEHNALLWTHFTDQEIVEIHAAIVAASSPADIAGSARWMIPNLSPAERAALFAGVRATLPAEAYAGILALARSHLSPEQWQRLAADLDIPTTGMQDAVTVARRFIDAIFVRFDADAAAALVADDFVAHPWAPFGLPPGPAGLAPVTAAFREAFGGVSATISDIFSSGDRVALRYEYTGIHAGPLFGIPATGKPFRFSGIAILRMGADGRVAEYWREEDVMTLQRQLGLASLLPEHQDADGKR